MAQKKKNDQSMPRRDFLKHSVVAGAALGSAGVGGCDSELASEQVQRDSNGKPARGKAAAGAKGYNTWYRAEQLDRIAFPMGGMGAGMICLDGTGSFSHLSLRHQPDVYNEPNMFGAICVKGEPNVARVLEGPVPRWKAFGPGGTGNGAAGRNYGLTRCTDAAFLTRFPFATIKLTDKKLPLQIEMTGWSPFVPGDPDSASLPMAGLDYTFSNKSKKAVEAVFSFNSNNFMLKGNGGQSIRRAAQPGFLLWNEGTKEQPHEHGVFCISTPDPAVKVSHSWFRGGWWDPLTMLWKDIQTGACYDREPVTEDGPGPGATLFVPFTLEPGRQKTITVQLSWYVPVTDLRAGPGGGEMYAPWYSGKFKTIEEVAGYWRDNYQRLRDESKKFSDCFYDMTLPPEVIEAVAANLTILKSPTVLRQSDGKLWAWEGCGDGGGCCHGSCTHVWNYAQALSHLFPSLERTLRETEFGVSQDDKGHQTFRASLPIRQPDHNFHAACDGQLGGIMKVYREWRISGDTDWLRSMWPKVRASMNYCIQTWDPGKKGILEEPHHNTYDIEFWGPDGMCTSFYLGALTAAAMMGKTLNEDVAEYESLVTKGLAYMQSELFDGEYFFQKVVANKNPDDVQSFRKSNAPESTELFAKEGPKYQYGTGCLSDGILGEWMAEVCGVGSILDAKKAASHLNAIHRYNFKSDLIEHVNPQRPSYAFGIDGGLLLCSWPKGGEPSLPFVYSNEVWTGIEYQVASHLMIAGMVEQGLEIVRAARDRYDGEIRNPFNEYECGHWYARAMSSYALIQGMTGVRYDAIDKALHIKPSIKGDFRAFLSTATGYATVGVKGGKPFVDVKSGSIEVNKIDYAA